MISICFTGKGNRHGSLVTRDVWSAEAERCGFVIHDKVHTHTTYLVASRSDTSKARAAALNGTTVLSYDQFQQLMQGIAPRVVGRVEREPKADPAKLAAAIDEASQSIEGWGSF